MISLKLSRVMRKPAFCISEDNDTAQLRSICAADQRFCFSYIGSKIPLLPKIEIKPLAIFCGCTAHFVSDLVGNPDVRFSRDAAKLQGNIDSYVAKHTFCTVVSASRMLNSVTIRSYRRRYLVNMFSGSSSFAFCISR